MSLFFLSDACKLCFLTTQTCIGHSDTSATARAHKRSTHHRRRRRGRHRVVTGAATAAHEAASIAPRWTLGAATGPMASVTQPGGVRTTAEAAAGDSRAVTAASHTATRPSHSRTCSPPRRGRIAWRPRHAGASASAALRAPAPVPLPGAQAPVPLPGASAPLPRRQARRATRRGRQVPRRGGFHLNTPHSNGGRDGDAPSQTA